MEQLGQLGHGGRGGGLSLSNMIHDLQEKGINPTHFLVLSFNFSALIPRKTRNLFNKKFFKRINNQRFCHTIGPGDEVHIVWQSPNASQSAFYYSVCRFEDTYFRQLTRGLIHGAFRKVLEELELSDDRVRVSYIPAKNTAFEIDLISGQAVCSLLHSLMPQESVGFIGAPATPSINWESGEMLMEPENDEDME